jgi:hypothetical protein
LIAPSGIGVPVAATPGLVPQDEAETVPAGAELDAGADAEELAEDAEVEAEELVEDELELQPATTPIASTAAAAAAGVRQWKGLFMCSAFSWLTAS